MNYAHIFIRSSATLEEMAALVRSKLGLPLAYDEEEGEFVSLDGDRRVSFGPSIFKAPPFAPADEFDFDLSLDGRNHGERQEYAKRAFRHLIPLGHALLLVDNAIVLDRFEPEPGVTAGADAKGGSPPLR